MASQWRAWSTEPNWSASLVIPLSTDSSGRGTVRGALFHKSNLNAPHCWAWGGEDNDHMHHVMGRQQAFKTLGMWVLTWDVFTTPGVEQWWNLGETDPERAVWTALCPAFLHLENVNGGCQSGKGKPKQPYQSHQHRYRCEIYYQFRSEGERAGRVLRTLRVLNSILPSEYPQADQVDAQKNIRARKNSKSCVKEWQSVGTAENMSALAGTKFETGGFA